jgi:hypothetical protein
MVGAAQSQNLLRATWADAVLQIFAGARKVCITNPAPRYPLHLYVYICAGCYLQSYSVNNIAIPASGIPKECR